MTWLSERHFSRLGKKIRGEILSNTSAVPYVTERVLELLGYLGGVLVVIRTQHIVSVLLIGDEVIKHCPLEEFVR
jgi:hypothetical protein